MGYPEEYYKWRDDPFFDEKTRQEVAALSDGQEIEDRFGSSLTFGTGGLRGILGAGTNRMNVYTVGKATQGLSDYINSKQTNGSVAIAFDSRKMSKEFALDTALILAANGIKAYLFDSLRPTPELSFAVRYLKTTAGIVITASHNPREYNGYKVYWSDGGQIVPPYDREIIAYVNAVGDWKKIRRTDRAQAEQAGLLEIIGQKVDEAYIAALKALSLNSETIKAAAKELRIVYTPLNGTGNLPVRRILHELGFENVFVVPEQELPDGNFPTLHTPNPEDKCAFELALRLAEKENADLVLATDPDADRLGVYVKDGETYIPFTGNMSGILIGEYVISQRAKRGLLPETRGKGALVTTVVSSKMAFEIAKEYGLTVIETLTGFKYIGEQIKKFEESGDYVYEFGYEESYGCLVGTHARDKDAIAAVAMLCEAAAYYRTQGLTLWDRMQDIYRKYGFYAEDLASFTLPGTDGAEKIAEIMRTLRENPPKEVGGERVHAVRDYGRGERIEFATGESEQLLLPKSNVLYFELENNDWCCVRPSGTEPKIKLYFGDRGTSRTDALTKLALIKSDLMKLAKN